MTSSSARRLPYLGLLLLPFAAAADDWQYGGHIKYRAGINYYDATSVFSTDGDFMAFDQDASLRLKLEKRDGGWDYKFHYEVGALYGNTLEASRSLSLPFGSYGIVNDDYRLFNLTSTIYDEGRAAVVHRIDRASVGYASGNFVFRAGRDAVSWGHGVVFQPMDIFNPFAPTAVDKEYKTGDDLLYTQWLFESGNDLQAIAVLRRGTTSTVDAASSSLAAKYRASVLGMDVDILLARHYSENIFAYGTAMDWRGAVVRGDLTLVDTANGAVLSGVSNISYSWVWNKHNVSGFAEYYRNGFGQEKGDYGPGALAGNTALLDRLSRGELFNIGRDYFAGGLTIELTPRWLLSPTLFWNINDGSALWQFGANFDWKENTTLLFGGIVPVGPQGTEYGGIPLGGGKFYRPATGVYGRVAYYF